MVQVAHLVSLLSADGRVTSLEMDGVVAPGSGEGMSWKKVIVTRFVRISGNRS